MNIGDKAVQDAAYYIWLKRERPEGQDTEIWLEAKQSISLLEEKRNMMIWLEAKQSTRIFGEKKNTMKGDLSVEILHEASISELINSNPEFTMFDRLRIVESDRIRWKMGGKTIYCT